jgi:peroxiredoxin
MAQLRQDYDKFLVQDTYWKNHKLPFLGLPDPKHTVLKRYGQEVSLFKFGRMPAQVAIDKTGTARFVHYGHDATDIPANEEILDLLKIMTKENHVNS